MYLVMSGYEREDHFLNNYAPNQRFYTVFRVTTCILLLMRNWSAIDLAPIPQSVFTLPDKLYITFHIVVLIGVICSF